MAGPLGGLGGWTPPDYGPSQPESTGDPFIDSLIAQGYQIARNSKGGLYAFKPGDRRNPADTISIPDYFEDGGSGSRLASDDPRYWQLQYAQLAAQLMNSGLDAESARRQALATLITNRNNTAVSAADLSAQIAKQKADYMANPRDAFAELYYGNQVGGSTPFGDTNNPEFAKYRGALTEKGNAMFTDVNSDLGKLREYRDSIPPVDFLNPTPAVQQILRGTGGGLPASTATAPANDIAGALQWLAKMGTSEAPTQAGLDFRKWVTPQAMAKGGQIDFDGMVKGREMMGASPSSSEGGTNINIHERAIIVGESGKVYGMMGEKREDGTVRAEQLIIKPLPSEVEKDKKLEEAGKAIVESQKKTMASFAEGGSVTAGQHTPEELMAQLSQMLNRLGGSGGGTGVSGSTQPDPRMLAGAPWEALQRDRRNLALTYAGYSSLAGGGIDPLTLEDTIKKFTPNAPINNSPRTSFI